MSAGKALNVIELAPSKLFVWVPFAGVGPSRCRPTGQASQHLIGPITCALVGDQHLLLQHFFLDKPQHQTTS